MADTSGLALREPEKINWDDYNPGSKYQAPPAALGPDEKPITYFGQLPKVLGAEAFQVTEDGDRRYQLDPITIVKSGSSDGYQLRFTRVSTKQWKKKDGTPMNASSVGNMLRSVGLQAKPQTIAEYDAAVRQSAGRVASFTIDWEARNKETGESIKGYKNFPLDPERPGQRKAILKAGDTYTAEDGSTQVVKAEVLFANARLRFFSDPSRK